jgi:DNA-binding transcriptional LysR family regulator
MVQLLVGKATEIRDKNSITRRGLPLNALRAFEAVGQHLSFTAGAASLSVSQSAVSRHVLGLEELFGKPLFLRDATGLALTSAGEQLLPVVTKCLDRMEQTLNMIRDDRLAKRALRLHVPPSLLQQQLLPLLREFRAENPDCRLDVSSAHVTGLPSTSIDMAIVFDRPSVDDFVTDLLWIVRVAPLCSPETASGCDQQSLAQFLAVRELLHVKLDDQPRDLLWSAFARRLELDFETSGGFAFDTAIAAAQYAMNASGVFLGDIDMFAREIADGRLVMPFDAVVEDGYGYYLKLHADDLSDPLVSTFRSWLIGCFAQRRFTGAAGSDPAPSRH